MLIRRNILIYLILILTPYLFGSDCHDAISSSETITQKVLSHVRKLPESVELPFCYHFEICELKQLPAPMREAIFTSLGMVTKNFSGIETVLKKSVLDVLKGKSINKVIELGSGSGDGLNILQKLLPNDLELVATDIFPSINLWDQKFRDQENLRYIENKVSFENFDQAIPKAEFEGSAILVVSTLHHIESRKIIEFLKKVKKLNTPLIIVEPLQRDLYGMLVSLGAVFPSLMTPILIKGVSFKKRLELALFHWLLPIVPISFIHDGIVSTLRQRGLKDWQSLVKPLSLKVTHEKNLGPLQNFSTTIITP